MNENGKGTGGMEMEMSLIMGQRSVCVGRVSSSFRRVFRVSQAQRSATRCATRFYGLTHYPKSNSTSWLVFLEPRNSRDHRHWLPLEFFSLN